MEKLSQLLSNIEQEIQFLEREIEKRNHEGLSCLVFIQMIDSYKRILKW